MTKEQLRRVRERLGLSQAELSERLKVDRSTVTRMENGKQAITQSMELLISYVAREAGIEIASHSQSGGRHPALKKAGRASVGSPKGKNRARPR